MLFLLKLISIIKCLNMNKKNIFIGQIVNFYAANALLYDKALKLDHKTTSNFNNFDIQKLCYTKANLYLSFFPVAISSLSELSM